MWDTIIVAVIVCAAAAYAIGRVFLRPSCGCGNASSCGGCGAAPRRNSPDGCGENAECGSCAGKGCKN